MEPAGETLRIDYAIGLPDLLAVVERSAGTTLARNSLRRMLSAALMGSIAAAFAWLPSELGLPFALGLGAATAIAWWWAMPWFVRRTVLARMATRLAEPANAPMLGPRTLVIDAQGLSISSETTELRYRWPALQRLVVARGRLFLGVSGMQSHVLPLAEADVPRVLARLRELAPEMPIVEERGR